jgi:hypothetical protein
LAEKINLASPCGRQLGQEFPGPFGFFNFLLKLNNMERAKIFLITSFFLLFLFNFAHAQSPISDLTCRQDVSAGAVWLSWTVPGGIASSNAYEVRYIQGNTMHWDNAIIFSQNWSSGTPGAKKQELVTGLNPGTQYTFAIKWKNETGNWSDPSNPATCIAPFPQNLDKILPKSVIEKPKSGDQFFEGEDIKIEGWAKDEGGSSVQKVEISLDGVNWLPTTPVKTENGILYWEYLWLSPKVGEYQIKTKAYDWVGNVETPSGGIKVSVVSQLPKEVPPTPPAEKPISQMTPQELRAKIIEIQLKLIQLLQQLIQILQEKLAQLKR